MADDRSTDWEARYSGGDYIYGTSPNQYLRAQAYRLTAGARVLVAADGEGRNGVWLAGQGMRVTSVDQSVAGQHKALRLAAARGVSVEFVCADLATWSAGVEVYDAAVAIFAHFPAATRARIHASLANALRPGGLLILEAFHRRQLGRTSGGPRDDAMLYDRELLTRDFPALTVLELLEGTVLLDEGPKHQGEGYVVRFVGRR